MSNNSNDEPLHVRVRAERKRRGWTQEHAAELAGMKPRAWQDFEAGRTKPQPANLRGILRAFNMDEADEAARVETVESWPADIRVFLDMMGAFLATMDEETRLQWMHEETRRIMGANHPSIPTAE